MSTYGATPLVCPRCGATSHVVLPESANVTRRPAYRQEVLDRTFMRFACEGCGDTITVERELLYTDFPHGLFVLCFPAREATRHRRHAALAREVFRRAVHTEAPGVVAAELGHLEPRVTFGWEELREKVLASDHGLDDRVLEMMKHALMTEIPGASEAGVQHLLLVSVIDDELAFLQVGPPLAEERPLLVVARRMYDDMATALGRQVVRDARWLEGPYVHQRLIGEVPA